MILSRILLQNITRRSSLLLPLSSTATSAATLSHFSRSYAARSSSKTPPPTDNPSLPGDIYIGEVPLPPPSPTPIPSPSPPSEPASAVTPLSSSAPPASPPTQKNLAEEFMSDALDLQPSPPSSSFGATTGARSRTQTSSTSDRKRRNLSRMAVLFGLATVVGSTAWLGREWEEGEGDKLIARSEDEDGKEWVKKDEWYWKWAGRARLRGADLFDYLNKPAWDPLLPPPLPPPHFKPYTLVIDLDDLLVHSSWDTAHGWRTAKRPGLDYFLAYLSIFYEIVLFTTQPAYTAMPIIEKIDPYGAYIPWKLYRESTRYKNKSLIKDLTYLGRPLSRVIVLETNPSHTQLQPENTILLEPWLGAESSPAVKKELVDLIPFLEAVSHKNVQDVRVLIQHYGGKDIGRQYAEREAEVKREAKEKWEKEQKERGWLVGLLKGLIKGPAADAGPPETDVEKARKRAIAFYLEEQKYWKDNEEEIKKQMDEDRERQLKEMKGSLMTFMGGPPSQPKEKPEAQAQESK